MCPFRCPLWNPSLSSHTAFHWDFALHTPMNHWTKEKAWTFLSVVLWKHLHLYDEAFCSVENKHNGSQKVKKFLSPISLPITSWRMQAGRWLNLFKPQVSSPDKRARSYLLTGQWWGLVETGQHQSASWTVKDNSNTWCYLPSSVK